MKIRKIYAIAVAIVMLFSIAAFSACAEENPSAKNTYADRIDRQADYVKSQYAKFAENATSNTIVNPEYFDYYIDALAAEAISETETAANDEEAEQIENSAKQTMGNDLEVCRNYLNAGSLYYRMKISGKTDGISYAITQTDTPLSSYSFTFSCEASNENIEFIFVTDNFVFTNGLKEMSAVSGETVSVAVNNAEKSGYIGVIINNSGKNSGFAAITIPDGRLTAAQADNSAIGEISKEAALSLIEKLAGAETSGLPDGIMLNPAAAEYVPSRADYAFGIKQFNDENGCRLEFVSDAAHPGIKFECESDITDSKIFDAGEKIQFADIAKTGYLNITVKDNGKTIGFATVKIFATDGEIYTKSVAQAHISNIITIKYNQQDETPGYTELSDNALRCFMKFSRETEKPFLISK